MPTKEQLQKRVRELEAENDELHDQLDQIFDIVAPEVGDGGDRGDEDKDGDSGEDWCRRVDRAGGAKESSMDSKVTDDFCQLFAVFFCPFFCISRPNLSTVFTAFRDFFQFAGDVWWKAAPTLSPMQPRLSVYPSLPFAL
jgi:hypothetical protein